MSDRSEEQETTSSTSSSATKFPSIDIELQMEDYNPDNDNDNDNENDNENDNDSDRSDETDDPESEFSLDSSDEIDEDEIDQLLEQGLPESQRIPKRKLMIDNEQRRVENEFNEKEIIVLEEKSKNTFDVLPGGWIEVRHSSGMPLYLHRKTRICTLAKPYFLGPGSVRRHSIPLSAIPCLAYRRAIADEEKRTLIPSKTCPMTDSLKENNDESILTTTDDAPLLVSDEEGEIKDEENLDSRKRKSTEMIEEQLTELKRAKLSETLNNDECEQEVKTNDFIPTVGSVTENVECTQIDSETHENETPEGSQTVKTESTDLLHSPPIKINESDSTNTTEGSANLLPLAKVATAKENNSLNSITPIELREYCKPLFKFKSVKCKRFKTWSARRKHTKEQKRLQLQRPSLPEGVKLISFPIHNEGATVDGVKVSKEYIMNPHGKSSVCILHEYVQHALRKQPSYIFRELENASTPYAATVVINDMQYGTGYGSSKKQAKADAAKATLEILIPQMKEQLDGKETDKNEDFDILTFFQPFGLQEMAISKWCKNFSEPPPYGLLLTCLQRNFGKGTSSNVKFEMISTGNQSNKFRMQVGEHSVEVTAANKREGKQLASQNLLSKLHPHIKNFGAFIKLYGNNSIKSVKEKKQEEQQITTLQSKASANSPNWAILSKLKEEMEKLKKEIEKDPIID